MRKKEVIKKVGLCLNSDNFLCSDDIQKEIGSNRKTISQVLRNFKNSCEVIKVNNKNFFKLDKQENIQKSLNT